MNYETEEITRTLRDVRRQKGLSQRALSTLVGLPQSHISKIEKNAVNLRISNLIAIAHALDLEIALVPHKAVPAVKSITQSVTTSPMTDPAIGKEFRKVEKTLRSVNPHLEVLVKFNQLQRNFKEISQFQNLVKDVDRLRDIRKSLENFKTKGDNESIDIVIEQINTLRISLADTQSDADSIRPARPAYRLDGDDG